MEEIIYYSALFDYYQNLLTDVQRKYFEDYYFNNLSLQEIADSYDVSRNAISKTLKEIKEKLDYYESNLKLLGNNKKIRELLSEEDLKRIENHLNERKGYGFNTIEEPVNMINVAEVLEKEDIYKR